jgi:hypothetical protein
MKIGLTVVFGRSSPLSMLPTIKEAWSHQGKIPHFEDTKDAVFALWDFFKTNPDFECSTGIWKDGEGALLIFKNRQEVQDAVKDYL